MENVVQFIMIENVLCWCAINTMLIDIAKQHMHACKEKKIQREPHNDIYDYCLYYYV